MGAVHPCSICFSDSNCTIRVKATYTILIYWDDGNDFTLIEDKIYREHEELMRYFGFKLSCVNSLNLNIDQVRSDIKGTRVHLCEKCFKSRINLELKEGHIDRIRKIWKLFFHSTFKVWRPKNAIKVWFSIIRKNTFLLSLSWDMFIRNVLVSLELGIFSPRFLLFLKIIRFQKI